jgi:hypothetical protein
MTLWVVWSIKKISDATHRELYHNIQKTTTPDDLSYYKLPDTLDITSSQLSKALKDDNNSQQHQREQQALRDYTNTAFPPPNYETPPQFDTDMVQERIRTSLHAGQYFPTGIEDYPLYVIKAQGTAALCATGTISQLKTTNTRSPLMWKFFGLSGKNTRNLEQLLSQHGWKSIINTKDQYSYYEDRSIADHNLPSHYNNLLRQADHIPANSILTARYADSKKLNDAKQTDKISTHSLRSLGQITQDLTFKQLWLTGDNLTVFQNTKDQNEQQAILIRHLLYQRQIKNGMCWDFKNQAPRIRQLLKDYPKLLTVTRDDAQAHFHGTMVDHVYPIGQTPTNFVHYLFEIIAYNGSNKDGSKFLIGDILIAWLKALKYDSYNQISPLYKQIETIRHPFMNKNFIWSTYIVNFDDIDLNHNKKIDKTDKTIHEVLDEIVITRHTNHGQKEWLTIDQTRSYITKYLTILWAMDRFPTGTMIPLPILTSTHRNLINSWYEQYITLFNTFRDASKEKYFSHIVHDIIPNVSNISIQGNFVYPVCFWDDNITITQKICTWIDLLSQRKDKSWKKKNDIHTGIKLWTLTREEYNTIHTIVSPYISYKDTKTVQTWQIITIDIPGILWSPQFQSYIAEQKKLANNYLPTIDHSVLGRFDDLMKILDIDESNRTILQHYILRETGGEISFFDIASSQFGKNLRPNTRIGRWRLKMIGEKLDFDDRLSDIKEISSQWPLQTRIKYFIKWDAHKIDWIIQSSNDLLANDRLHLTTNQKNDLKEIISIAKPLLIQKNRKRSLDDKIKEYDIQKKGNYYKNLLLQQKNNNIQIQQWEEQLLHILSDIINLTPSSLSDPLRDLGTLLSIKMNDYKIDNYKSHYAWKLRKYLNVSWLTVEQVAFVQEFGYIANHVGNPLNEQYRDDVINFYTKKKKNNPNYSMIELHNEPDLQYIYKYSNTLPPHRDIPSATLWWLISIFSAWWLYKTKKKKAI